MSDTENMNQQPESIQKEQVALPIPGIVYHASGEAGLLELKPHKGTHQQPWVYATPEIALAALFLNHKGRDLSCALPTQVSPGLFETCYAGRVAKDGYGKFKKV